MKNFHQVNMKFAKVPTVILLAFCAQSLLCHVKADVYMHNPRGSNNRLDGQEQNRRNGNRLFDSQNNAKGGYNAGERSEQKTSTSRTKWYHMQYFMSGKNVKQSGKTGKSFLTIEWTNQHGCGDGDLNCNIVLQYMLQPIDEPISEYAKMRNGQTVQTPRFTARPPVNFNHKNQIMNDDRRNLAGLHEPWEWYSKCITRERNRGLFTADQKLRRSSSIYTRQNNGGTRRGYECPEERDYYPYWHPTEWIDIAVLAKNKDDCPYYKRESFNVQPKGECMEKYRDGKWKHASSYNNPKDCRKNGGTWVKFRSSLRIMWQYTTEDQCKAASTDEAPLVWDVPYVVRALDHMPVNKDPNDMKHCLLVPDPPDCREAPRSRPNHLGNGEGVTPLTYDWILPYIPYNKSINNVHEKWYKSGFRCVLRLRYNISTDDYNVSDTFAESNQQKARNIVTNQSPIVNDPVVDVGSSQIPLQLAINTAQFGRTFQDRSHIFHLLPRPDHLKDRTIYNVNVRGKRGNIVQAYPAVEYDFVPKRLSVTENECVHFQWTGSNKNPGGNAGEGRRQTDRSNVVAMSNPDQSYPVTSVPPMLKNAKIVHVMEPLRDRYMRSNENFGEPNNAEDLTILMASAGSFVNKKHLDSKKRILPDRTSRNWRRRREYKAFAQLDFYSPSFPGVLLSFTKGTYYYMCSRNNNFTNRSQKARLTVT